MRPEPAAVAVAPAPGGSGAGKMSCFAASGAGNARAPPTFPSFSRFVTAQPPPPPNEEGRWLWHPRRAQAGHCWGCSQCCQEDAPAWKAAPVSGGPRPGNHRQVPGGVAKRRQVLRC
eukprot:2836406-Lingulodinium_polyedra.AAC.1